MAPEAGMAGEHKSSLLAGAKGEGPAASPRRELLTVGLLVLAALAFRLFLMRYARLIEFDGAAYLLLAREILAGKLYVFYGYLHPQYFVLLYSLLTAAMFPLVGDWELAGRLVSMVFGSLTAVPVYLLGKMLYGRRAGYCAAGLVAFLPALAGYSLAVLTEAMYTFLFMSGIGLGWWALQRAQGRYLFLAGMVLGLGYVARIVGLGNIGVMALLAVWHGLFVKGLKQKALGANLAILLLGASLFAVPNILFWQRAYGLWSPWGTNVGAMEADYVAPEARDRLTSDGLRFQYEEEVRQGNFVEALLGSVLKHPGLWSKLVLRDLYSVYRHFVLDLLPPAMLLLLALGLFRRRWGAEEIYLGVWLLASAVVPVLVIRARLRYFVPLLPITAVWAGRGVEQMGVWLAGNFPGRGGGLYRTARLYAPWLVLGAVMLSFALEAVHVARYNTAVALYEQRLVGEWMRRNLPPNPVIMHRRPELVYYAGGRFLAVPHEDYPRVINFARHAGADYLIVDKRAVAPVRPQLAFLLDETKAPPEDLQLVYKWEADPKYTVMVYKVLSGPRDASSP